MGGGAGDHGNRMSSLKRRWQQLLSHKRLGDTRATSETPSRTDFQRDYDRIVFSSAFRRLQDKTQVFPLAENDYVRTRLTHSLEVSCVGRSLGTEVGEQIIARHKLDKAYQSADFGAIVASACLAHDIGNPPFGHTGEDAIRQWFKGERGQTLLASLTEQQQQDLLRFEGNAQGFRLLTRLQSPDNPGGMQLTHAVLATFTKYPRPSHFAPEKAQRISQKKHGYFASEQSLFAEVAKETGLIEREAGQIWQRHPLCYLVEAADDISYQVIDLEDGYRQGFVSFKEVSGFLMPIIATDAAAKARLKKRLQGMQEEKSRVEYLRANAIGALVRAATKVFLDNEAAIVNGEFDRELVAETLHAKTLMKIKTFSFDRIYSARPVIEVEAAGYEVLGGLIELFAEAVEEVAAGQPSQRAETLVKLLPDQFLGPKRKPDTDRYTRLIKVTDFVAGMTDGFAVGLFKKVRGISLPRG